MYARYAGMSLLFRLWTFIPYRARNICEMQLDEHLKRTTTGKWHILFTGEQLKISRKKGRENIFDLPFPTKLVPTLETYLAVWRPLLARITNHRFRHIFLTQYGMPYNTNSLRWTTSNIVHRYTGQKWHPYIVRTVWATEWIRDKNPGDFFGAALMLNDTPQMVIDRYSHLLTGDAAEKIFERLSPSHGGIR